MKKKIEKILLETLVIENKQSIHIAVDKIAKLYEVSDLRIKIQDRLNIHLSDICESASQNNNLINSLENLLKLNK